MTNRKALTGCEIFDGEMRHRDCALIVGDGLVSAIVPSADLPEDMEKVVLGPGVLAPGFIDLQVNGGGGVLFNEKPDLATIETICAAHQRFGTTAAMVTLITDTREVRSRALEAGLAAQEKKVPGFLGLHLEGPHLSEAKRGAHDTRLLRAMDDDDLAFYKKAASLLNRLITTVAPEVVSDKQVSALDDAGIYVSLGHSNASYDEASAAANAGACAITHLFNAMSPLHQRDPGMVGVALENGALFAGLIADGFHVSGETIRIALRAKKGPGKIFLVTDAMSTVGTDVTTLTLNGRNVTRENGRLTLDDGTLAGADLDMMTALRFMVLEVGVELDEALRMAALYPAECIGLAPHYGCLKPGSKANIVHIDPTLALRQVWIEGRAV